MDDYPSRYGSRGRLSRGSWRWSREQSLLRVLQSHRDLILILCFCHSRTPWFEIVSALVFCLNHLVKWREEVPEVWVFTNSYGIRFGGLHEVLRRHRVVNCTGRRGKPRRPKDLNEDHNTTSHSR